MPEDLSATVLCFLFSAVYFLLERTLVDQEMGGLELGLGLGDGGLLEAGEAMRHRDHSQISKSEEMRMKTLIGGAILSNSFRNII